MKLEQIYVPRNKKFTRFPTGPTANKVQKQLLSNLLEEDLQKVAKQENLKGAFYKLQYANLAKESGSVSLYDLCKSKCGFFNFQVDRKTKKQYRAITEELINQYKKFDVRIQLTNSSFIDHNELIFIIQDTSSYQQILKRCKDEELHFIEKGQYIEEGDYLYSFQIH